VAELLAPLPQQPRQHLIDLMGGHLNAVRRG
jgi:hypothetical protein